MFGLGELVDLGLAVELYADAIGGIENLGANFQMTYIRWMRDGGLMVPVPVLRLIRPRDSLIGGDTLGEYLRQQEPPGRMNRVVRLHA